MSATAVASVWWQEPHDERPGMTAALTLDLGAARRLAVGRQQLAGAAPAPGMSQVQSVIRSLRCLQLDPIDVVARSQRLVLWSRLGVDPAPYLDKLMWDERWLFEYWAHAASLVLTEDYPLHAANMAAYPPVRSSYGRQVESWMAANPELRRYILETLRVDGPLPTRAFEDRATVAWASSGWTNGRSVERMLEFLWRQGEVMVAGRSGTARLWDLADRCLPATVDRTPMDLPDALSLAVEHGLRALGVAREVDIQRYFIRDYYGPLGRILAGLQQAGRVVPVQLGDDSGREQWYVHSDVLPDVERIGAGDWTPRTALLSPFDNLLSDRGRTERLWGFAFRNEMYIPKHKRQYGHYLMPILHGADLIGRISPRRDRARGVLVIEGIHLEPGRDAGADLRREVTAQIAGLATLVNAAGFEYGPDVAPSWTA
jgi:uncharacterized protein YcaQ